MISRIDRLKSSMIALGLDAIFISDTTNRRYLSGFTSSAGILLVCVDTTFLFVPYHLQLQAEQQCISSDIQICTYGTKELMSAIQSVLQINKLKRIGFESTHMSYQRWLNILNAANGSVDLIPIQNIVEDLRAIKDSTEIAIIRNAVNITEKILDFVCPEIKPGDSEISVAAQLQHASVLFGAEAVAFRFEVATGTNAYIAHAIPTQRNITSGELVTIDIGITYDGYNTDICRTIGINEINDFSRSTYDTVRAVRSRLLEHLYPGQKANSIAKLALGILNEYGVTKMPHDIGHGIGLQVHERPFLSPLSEEVLMPGMVLAIEPAIYSRDWGGVRIEDMVLITNDGCKLLSAYQSAPSLKGGENYGPESER